MRSAVFVDAGYLYSQGSKALGGAKRPDVELNPSEAIKALHEIASAKSLQASVLRIYWYDGLLKGERSRDQERLAETEDVKLRLGIVNVHGQQKGVDSLIVTDLVELARNHAITDAVLLSGDEDLRIGVVIAQSFGVRVHLLGIVPSRGSQSRALLEEADTTTEWHGPDISRFLSLKSPTYTPSLAPVSLGEAQVNEDISSALETAVREFVAPLRPQEVDAICPLGESDSIPSAIDRGLLASCRTKIGRDLDFSEKVLMRSKCKETARRKQDGQV